MCKEIVEIVVEIVLNPGQKSCQNSNCKKNDFTDDL